MKTPLMYGVIMAVASALLTLILFFVGFHDSPERMQSGVGKFIAVVVPLAITIICLALAMRDKRANTPADASWGYGSALWTGVLTAVFASLLGAVFAYLYFAVINPTMTDVLYQAEVAKMEDKGVSPEQIDQAERFMRKMMSPGIMTIFQSIGGFLITVVISLIMAIFFKTRVLAPDSSDRSPPVLPA
jgi:hypothetical protein